MPEAFVIFDHFSFNFFCMEIEFIIIKNEREIIRIALQELLYVKVDGSLISCHIEDGDKFSCSTSLRSIVNQLPGGFILINRNCLVNSFKVRKYHRQKREVTLSDASVHKVSARKVKDLTDKLIFEFKPNPIEK